MTAIDDVGLGLLSRCTQLSHISLGGRGRVSEKGLKALATELGSRLWHLTLPSNLNITDGLLQTLGSHTPELRELISEHTLFSNVGLDALGRGCRHLEVLRIVDADGGVTNSGLGSLAALCKSLRVLDLGYSQIDDWGLSAVLSHVGPNLEELDLTFSQVGDAGVRELATCAKKLRKLSLSDCRVTDEGVKYLVTHAPQLQSLKLDYEPDSGDEGKITDESLRYMGCHCKDLRYLSISNNPRITDAGVIAVTRGCTMLEELVLGREGEREAGVTDHAIEEMMRLLPREQCKRLTLTVTSPHPITDGMMQAWRTHRTTPSKPVTSMRITSFFAPVTTSGADV